MSSCSTTVASRCSISARQEALLAMMPLAGKGDQLQALNNRALALATPS
jgi:hypothetical protein